MPPLMKITGSARYRKSQKRAPMPLLPGDAGLLRQIENQREADRQSKMINEPLDYVGPLKNFAPVENLKAGQLDIVLVIRSILSQMWSEFPVKGNGNYALSPKVMGETAQFRAGCPPVVTMNQLYGVFPSSNTKVDRAVSQACRDGKIKLVQVSSTDGSRDLVLEAEKFYDMCDPISPQLGLLCRAKPDATWFDAGELVADGVDVAAAVNEGVLVVDPGRKGVHTLALPNQGRFLKLLRQAETWLVKTVVQYNRKFKELPESQILVKLDQSKRYWTQLRGVTLNWILYDAIGSGRVDGFETPMGRGWKVLKT